MHQEIIQNEMYVGYTRDTFIHSAASSGGIVSHLLIHLLQENIISGAYTSKITGKNNHITPVTEFSTSRESILTNGGSSYIFTPVINIINNLTFKDDKKVAVVTLPCQARAIRELQKKNPALQDRLIIISLFCGGSIEAKLYDLYFNKKNINLNDVEIVKIRRGYHDGVLSIALKSGEYVETSFVDFNTYRQAGYFAHPACFLCHEHQGEYAADISVGDIYTKEFRKKEKKHSAFICWTDTGQDILKQVLAEDKICWEYFGLETYNRKFRRTLKNQTETKSRKAAAKTLGVSTNQVEDINTGTFNFFNYISWILFIANAKFSKTKLGEKFIFLLPNKIINLIAYSIKGLQRISK